MRMITGRAKKVKIVFMFCFFVVGEFAVLKFEYLLTLASYFHAKQIVRLDPESKGSDGSKNEQISDEQFSLNIKGCAENVGEYNCKKGKQAK